MPARSPLTAGIAAATSAGGRRTARFKLPERLVLVDELATTKVDKKALRADIAVRLDAAI